MILADKIARLRKKNGWSQEELAEKMNVSRQAVSKWESAQTVPDLEKILMLGDLFGVTTDDLLKDEIESEEFTSGEEPAVRRLTLAEANEYLALRKTASVRMAAATFLCIFSVIPLLILGAMAEIPSYGISENAAGAAGLVVLFLFIAAAAIATVLNICPLMRLDNKGVIKAYDKVRGTHEAIEATVNAMEEHAQGGREYSRRCWICHSQCPELARQLSDALGERFPHVKGNIRICDIGTIIGSHAGPGTVAVFFYGDERPEMA